MSHGVALGIEAADSFELGDQVLAQTLVEVVAAQVVVAGSCQNLDNALAYLDDGNVERAASQVVHHDFLRRAVIKPVSERRRSRLVDDTQDIKACNATGIFRGLTLGVVEICGNGDNGIGDVLTKETLGIAL